MISSIGRIVKGSKVKSFIYAFKPVAKQQCRYFHYSYGSVKGLSSSLQRFIDKTAVFTMPDSIHICDGSPEEDKILTKTLTDAGTIVPLKKYKNCWLTRTDPKDVARVESKTFICTQKKNDTIPDTPRGVTGTLGNWMSEDDYDRAFKDRFKECMRGRTMYVIPFSMGPIGSPLAKYGVEITDSPYVVKSMKIMTRIGKPVWDQLKINEHYVKCYHSVGRPRSGKVDNPAWPCDPERTIILHKPAGDVIASYGSGYGGNSLLGKKCLALRIGSLIARREGWLAEHMLILGITNPKGVKKYIAAAFPSACGKTNLAMMTPTLPGYKVECVGDDIAWMKFDSNGVLRAINPEYGFFGVAPGTSKKTNPIAMKTIFQNTIFTNVASTSDGGVYWEGMEEDEYDKNAKITDWLGNPWDKKSGKPAAHPNSRFCTPASNCPIIDPAWEDPKGVPISAILFGGRRPVGVPLVYEAYSWKHGVFIGASMRSESTAAAEHKGKIIMHDPFAMRPFFGYNFGHYLDHWLCMEKRGKVPPIFHVNWFRKNTSGKFLWPGFGENCRVLDWILRRVDGEYCYVDTPIGKIPAEGSINTKGLKENINFKELFGFDQCFWRQEIEDVERYLDQQVGKDLPDGVKCELQQLRRRVD